MWSHVHCDVSLLHIVVCLISNGFSCLVCRKFYRFAICCPLQTKKHIFIYQMVIYVAFQRHPFQPIQTTAPPHFKGQKTTKQILFGAWNPQAGIHRGSYIKASEVHSTGGAVLRSVAQSSMVIPQPTWFQGYRFPPKNQRLRLDTHSVLIFFKKKSVFYVVIISLD